MPQLSLATSRFPTDWRSQDLIEALPAAVYVCNSEAVVVSYNLRAAELWGREPVPGDSDEKFCGSYRLYLPDGTFLPHGETPMAEVLRTGKPAQNKEVVIERPDGSRVTVLVNIAPLLDEDGTLVGAVNCFQDLTAQKQAETEKLRFVEELHQTKKVEALGQLTAGVAHDFNNLLTAILGNLEVLQHRVRDEDSLKLLKNAARAARRGADLNQQLLGFVRKQALVPEVVDLDQLLGRMAALLHASVGDAIGVEMRLGKAAWPALVNPTQIELIVLNLVINARDAMPSGGNVTIETRNATISAEDHTEDLAAGDYAVLSISDTGTGMSEAVRAQALEPFFTTKSPGKGCGLGLSMAHGVIKQSGGTLRIRSRLGEGTSIEIFLPRASTSS